MSVYRRDFDKTKYMYFLIKDEIFFDKYNEIWDIIKNEVYNIIKKKFNRELIYNKKYLKAEKKNQHKRRLSL